MGGQTALNCALDLAREGVLEKYGVELIGASREAIDKAEDRELFQAMRCARSASSRRARASRTAWKRRIAVQERSAFRLVIRPSFTLGGSGGGIAYNREEFEQIVARGLDASPTNEVLVEESVIGWKEFELEVVRDQHDNCHHRLLDREFRSDGRAYRRLDHGRAGADADRQGIPAHARRGDCGVCARSASIPAGPTCSSRSIPRTAGCW